MEYQIINGGDASIDFENRQIFTNIAEIKLHISYFDN